LYSIRNLQKEEIVNFLLKSSVALGLMLYGFRVLARNLHSDKVQNG